MAAPAGYPEQDWCTIDSQITVCVASGEENLLLYTEIAFNKRFGTNNKAPECCLFRHNWNFFTFIFKQNYVEFSIDILY